MESLRGMLALITLTLLAGCTSTTEEPFWVYDRLEQGTGGRGDLAIKSRTWGNDTFVMVEVREQVSLSPGEIVTLTEAEVECTLPADAPTRLANIPIGVGMIALTPLAVPVGIGLRVAGVKDIGHCDTLLLPLATLAMGALHTVPVTEAESSYVIHIAEDDREYRRTGRTRWERRRSVGGRLAFVESGGAVMTSDHLSAELLPERASIPRFGAQVRLIPGTGEATPPKSTDIHGMVVFEFTEETHPHAGFDIEISIDGRVHRAHVAPAIDHPWEPVLIDRS